MRIGTGIVLAAVLAVTVRAGHSENKAAEAHCAAVQKQTGIQWDTVTMEQQGTASVTKLISRPYPSRWGENITQWTGDISSTPIDKARAQEIAVSFLLRHADLLAGASGPTLFAAPNLKVREVIANKNAGEFARRGTDFTVVIPQHYEGLRVFEAETLVQVTQYGEIWSVDNGFRIVEAPPTQPLLSSTEALESARTALHNAQIKPDKAPELLIFPPSKLVWRMNFLAPCFMEMLIDATTGAVALSRKNVRDQSGADEGQIDQPPYIEEEPMQGGLTEETVESIAALDSARGAPAEANGASADLQNSLLGLCTARVRVRDKNYRGLAYALATYWTAIDGNWVLQWAKKLDENGRAYSTKSATGYSCFEVLLIGARVEVKDEDSNCYVYCDTPAFSTVAGKYYDKIVNLNCTSGVNTGEGSVFFREAMRAWYFVKSKYGFDRPLVTAWIDSKQGPSSSGDAVYFPHNQAKLDNGPPSSKASIDDTMLHEYGHCVQYAAYGGTWGRPYGCTCVNHGGVKNDCSHDSMVEGWAEYFPIMLYNRINWTDKSYDWSNSRNRRDIEKRYYTCVEERDEWSFAGVLFDINDGCNESSDHLSLGSAPIWNVFRHDRPKTVVQFYQKFCARYPGYASRLREIYQAHGMHPEWY